MSYKNIITEDLINEIKQSAIYNNVLNIIKENRLIKDRVKILNDLCLDIINKPVGSGGVGSIIFRKDGVYIQISYGVTRYNYADIVKIGFIRTNKDNPISKPYFIS